MRKSNKAFWRFVRGVCCSQCTLLNAICIDPDNSGEGGKRAGAFEEKNEADRKTVGGCISPPSATTFPSRDTVPPPPPPSLPPHQAPSRTATSSFFNPSYTSDVRGEFVILSSELGPLGGGDVDAPRTAVNATRPPTGPSSPSPAPPLRLVTATSRPHQLNALKGPHEVGSRPWSRIELRRSRASRERSTLCSGMSRLA
jgi:hypothetical protein